MKDIADEEASAPDDLDELEKFVLSNPELEHLEAMLSGFNVFETLDIVNAEIRHSNVLSWLLDPSSNHGIGSFFIRQFLKHLFSINRDYLPPELSLFDFEVFDYGDVEIRREWNRIDLLIIVREAERSVVVAIENKVKASEHSDQLQRYRQVVEKEFADYTKIYVYLTPGDLIPTDQNWLNFSYETVSELIDDTIRTKKDAMSEQVHSFINQYNTILRRYIVGNSQIEEICSQLYRKHQRALDLIFQYKPDVELEISQRLQGWIRQHHDVLVADTTAKTVIRFTTPTLDGLIEKVSEGWTPSKRIFLFEFGNYDGRLVLLLYVGPGPAEYRSRLLGFCKGNPNLFKLVSRTIGKKYHAVYKKEFLRKGDLDGATLGDLAPRIDKKLSEFLEDDLPKINDYFEKNWRSD